MKSPINNSKHFSIMGATSKPEFWKQPFNKDGRNPFLEGGDGHVPGHHRQAGTRYLGAE